MSVDAAAHSQPDGYGGSVIARRPLLTMSHQDPRSPSQLWQVRRCVLCFPRPGLKKGGLVTTHHSELCDGVTNLDGKSFTPSYVCNNPLIYLGQKSWPSRSETNTLPYRRYKTEQKGDLLVQNILQIGTDSIHDMYVMNTDALSYHKILPDKCPLTVYTEVKRKYLEACLQ